MAQAIATTPSLALAIESSNYRQSFRSTCEISSLKGRAQGSERNQHEDQEDGSEKVIAANRRNARKSTGPEDVSAVRYNATKHGLLMKQLKFLNEDDAGKFKALVEELEKDFAPKGAVQYMLLEENAVTWRNLRIAVGWELEDIANRQEASRELLRRFIHNSQDPQLSSLCSEDGRSAAFSTWECQGAVLRARSKGHGQDLLSDERNPKWWVRDGSSYHNYTGHDSAVSDVSETRLLSRHPDAAQFTGLKNARECIASPHHDFAKHTH
jgi:hypothetical protein